MLPRCSCSLLLTIVECHCFASRRAEDQLAYFPRWKIAVVVINDPELKPRHWLPHRTHFTDGVDQETWGVDHTKPLDEPEVEALFKGSPGMRGTACGEHHPNGVVGVVWSLWLFQQNGDHRAKGVKFHGIVLPALIPMPGGREALT